VVVDLKLTRPCALLKGFQGNREYLAIHVGLFVRLLRCT
jgi:hypothetical protein